MNDERRVFEELLSKASRFGFKPGFVTMQFKEQFGEFPKRSWAEELQRIFAASTSWQAGVEHRRIEREHFETWEREVRPIAEERKRLWLEKHRVVLPIVEQGAIIQVFQGSKGRPLHAMKMGEYLTLCGKLCERWMTGRKLFAMSTEYGCKKCKKIFGQRKQLTLKV